MTPTDPYAETDEWPTPHVPAQNRTLPASQTVSGSTDADAATGALRAEVERLTQHKAEWRDAAYTNKRQWMDAVARADAAEAELRALREGIRALHRERGHDLPVPAWCEADGRPWPCPTAVLLASATAATCTHQVTTYTDGEAIWECGQPATHELFDTSGKWSPVCDAHGRGLGVSDDRLRALPASSPAATTGEATNLNCPVCGSGEVGDCVCGPRGRCICDDPPVAREVVCRVHPNAHLPAPVSSGEAGTVQLQGSAKVRQSLELGEAGTGEPCTSSGVPCDCTIDCEGKPIPASVEEPHHRHEGLSRDCPTCAPYPAPVSSGEAGTGEACAFCIGCHPAELDHCINLPGCKPAPVVAPSDEGSASRDHR